ncbi:uncharacterized protein LOC119770476 [Culex quinquefasciatus]|uniref:uncharacterized protein LOC119770476 n=1 Tax=Culex quinquefasciatus TaxID=7176 RepID=UPI0018E2A118|nr:uncharacterized protein LOC119770476 [Culex quinquefasciatus]
MGCCSDIKFHGYFIGLLAGLLELVSLGLSVYLALGEGSDDSELPQDLLDLASSSPLDYVGDVAILVSVGLLFYGIYKENRCCLIPFTVAICYDWISYLAYNIDRSMPYHVWLVTTAFFVYIFVAMLSLFILFGINVKTTKTEQFVKFGSDNLV